MPRRPRRRTICARIISKVVVPSVIRRVGSSTPPHRPTRHARSATHAPQDRRVEVSKLASPGACVGGPPGPTASARPRADGSRLRIFDTALPCWIGASGRGGGCPVVSLENRANPHPTQSSRHPALRSRRSTAPAPRATRTPSTPTRESAPGRAFGSLPSPPSAGSSLRSEPHRTLT